MYTLDNLSKKILIHLVREYDNYIQEANEEERYRGSWKPVCISEFLNNDYLELIDDMSHLLDVEYIPENKV